MTPLELALHYVSLGLKVFPCRSKAEEATDPYTGEVTTLGEKTPLTSNGFRGATRFQHIVNRWFNDWPDAAVGIPTGKDAGFFVLDIDNKPGGANGFEWLAEMEAEHGPLPETARVMSPNGGEHIYFKYVDGTRNRGNLGAGADIRSEGGYVVAAGSVMADGRAYRWTVDADGIPPIADAPAWLLDLVVRRTQEQPAIRHGGVVTNSAYVNAAVDRELSELAAAQMGTRNSSLNDAAFALGQFVGAGALTESEARALLQDVARGWGRDWSRCCKTIENGLAAGIRQPRDIPQPERDNTRLIDITKMIENGLRKARDREHGAPATTRTEPDTAPSLADEQTPAPTQDNAPQPGPAPAFTATPFTYKDPRTLPRREFAFGTHYIRKFVSVTVSPGGLGKTSNSIVEALSMVSGRALTGTKPATRMSCWLFNAEDPRDEMDRRIMAACLHYKLQPEDIDGRLFLDTGREQELVIMHEDKKTGLKINEPVVEAIVEQIRRYEIDVMIIDPFVSTHRVNENDNGAIDKVAKLWAQIADMTNCAVDVVHHLRKMSDREATVEDARGAVSLIGAARSVRVLNRMTEDQATKAGVEPKERFSYFWIHYGKANLTKLDSGQHWRRMESVALGNGAGLQRPQDHAGVVTEWHWPSKDAVAAAIPDDVRAEVLVRLANQNCRASDQSSDWAGYVLAQAMGSDMETSRAMTPEKRRIKAALDSWIANGILAEVDEDDPRHVGRKIKFVRPAKMAG